MPHKVVHMLHFLHFDLVSVNFVLTESVYVLHIYIVERKKKNAEKQKLEKTDNFGTYKSSDP